MLCLYDGFLFVFQFGANDFMLCYFLFIIFILLSHLQGLAVLYSDRLTNTTILDPVMSQ